MAAANGTPGGQAPVVQQQNGPLLDPRGKRKAAKAARQQAAAAKKAAAMQGAAAAPAAAAVPNPNCTIIVPANPLTAAGLATPYQLVATDAAAGPCNEANVNQSAFVQAAIISPAGTVSLYDPLVIDQGTMPLVPAAPVAIPTGSTVGIWFGFNGDNLTLANAAGTSSLAMGNCVNGVANSIFGQFASCNGAAFLTAGNAAVAAGTLVPTPIGTALDGLPCPTVRDFSLVDQDQSDNVTTHVLAVANGQTGQNNAATRAAAAQLGQVPVDLANGSDNRLLNVFVAPTLGCTPWMLPNQASDNTPTPSLPLNELQAAQQQAAPIALIPLNDPMATVNAMPSPNKVNAFRAAVGQPPLNAAGSDDGNGATYCMNLFQNPAGIARVFKDMAIFQNGASPDPAAATNLFTFLAMRASDAFMDGNLGCMALTNLPNPITLTVNGNNVVTAATYTPAAAGAGNGGAANNGNGMAAMPSPTMSPAAGTGATPMPTVTPTPAAGTGTTTTKHKKHHKAPAVPAGWAWGA